MGSWQAWPCCCSEDAHGSSPAALPPMRHPLSAAVIALGPEHHVRSLFRCWQEMSNFGKSHQNNHIMMAGDRHVTQAPSVFSLGNIPSLVPLKSQPRGTPVSARHFQSQGGREHSRAKLTEKLLQKFWGKSAGEDFQESSCSLCCPVQPHQH